jgi:hypothetical protein
MRNTTQKDFNYVKVKTPSYSPDVDYTPKGKKSTNKKDFSQMNTKNNNNGKVHKNTLKKYY